MEMDDIEALMAEPGLLDRYPSPLPRDSGVPTTFIDGNSTTVSLN